ncbi:SHSP domain-containing protein [Plasmodiophora brassicae]|uniref:SHSP domain-containing protein n=2 Tax=Plasmodiophora brassicae TaxID=37360 RepID=A0A0G4ILJ3_PLABS|nr:hypothetical protein PBRA_004766 [Plasmodiophora brassicae]
MTATSLTCENQPFSPCSQGYDSSQSQVYPSQSAPFGYQGRCLARNHLRAEIKDNITNYLLDIETPGVKKDDVQIGFETANMLNVTVNFTKHHSQLERGKMLYAERGDGIMLRQFKLPIDADLTKIQAKQDVQAGILRVTLGKLVCAQLQQQQMSSVQVQ